MCSALRLKPAGFKVGERRNTMSIADQLTVERPRPVTNRDPVLAGFKSAIRVQQSFLARVEKRVLLWMAERTPSWINSDHLTAMGSAGMLMAGVCYGLARWHVWALLGATFCLGVNWLGDSLDGTLARVRNRQRPRYGFYIDHVLDTFGAFFLIGGLAISGYMHPMIASGMLVAFLMLSIEVYLATYTIGSFHLSFWKFGPTEVRMLLAIGNCALLFRPMAHILGRSWRVFDLGGVIAIGGMAVMLIFASIKHTRRLYREERLP